MVRVPHIRITVAGSMTGQVPTPEIFSFGFVLADPTGDPTIGLPSPAECDQVEALVRAMFTRPATAISNQAALRQITIASVGTSGKVNVQPDGSYLQKKYVYGPTTVTGGGGALAYPYQVANVVTLSSSASSGAKLGRIFLPSPTVPVGNDGTYPAAAASDCLNSVKTCFQAINALPMSVVVAVASGGSVPKGLPARNYPVVQLRVGRVLDTMRSRRNQLAEAYTSNGV
jgi:hypothetical protein